MSPSFVTRENSNRRQKEWEDWYDKKTHEYRGRPTRRLKKHFGLSKLDSTVLFKIRSNKGWKTDDKLGTAPPPNCDNCEHPDDGKHKLTCPRWAAERPPNAEQLMYDIKKQPQIVHWIRHHKHFGIKTVLYEARYINLRCGNYNRNIDYTCPDCPYITSSKYCYESHRATHAKGAEVRTPVDPSSLVCPHCGKISQNRAHHETHIGKHVRQASALSNRFLLS